MIITRNLGLGLLGLGMLIGGILMAVTVSIPPILIIIWLILTGAALLFNARAV